MRIATICLAAAVALLSFTTQAQAPSGMPVFEVTRLSSSVKFDVKASVAIKGKFDTWGTTLTFQSPDVTTGALEINIQADSVDTGSGMKNRKLKGKDFFDVEHYPAITFKSTKIVPVSREHFEVDGNLTIRNVTNPEKLILIVSHNESHLGDIKGKMVFDRKKYGMNKGIPFISIADHVEINIHLKTKHTSGPQLSLNWQPTGHDDRNTVTSSTQFGENVSHLSILEKLGVGMGAVYWAEEAPPLPRHTEIPV